MPLATLMIHVALILIVAGAFITFFSARRGTIKLEKDAAPTANYVAEDGSTGELPFSVSLKDCDIDYYPGTSTPSDYSSEIEVNDNGARHLGTVAMNQVYTYSHYRFYQTGMGQDYTVLSLNYDPWGIAVSYSGYFLLMASMLAFFFVKRSRFHSLIKGLGVVVALICVSGSATAASSSSEDMPEVLQRPLAKSFGEMYVYWNGRVVPLQTMAKEFCLKVYGKPSYRGLTPEQVLTGWLFYYDSWKTEPMIRVKGESVGECIGADGKYATLKDFYDREGLKLARLPEDDRNSKAAMEAMEKIDLISQVCTGSAWKIYPVGKGEDITWLSWTDTPAGNLSEEELAMIYGSMDEVSAFIQRGMFRASNESVKEIIRYQEGYRKSGILPSESATKAERIYNALPALKYAGIAAILLGLGAFAVFCIRERRNWSGKRVRTVSVILKIMAGVILLYLLSLFILRWVAGGHVPLANGYETMLGIAIAAGVLSLVARGKYWILFPMGMIVSGLACMVSTMGEGNPAIGHLVPVLSSPLLSIHVMLVMVSYALFAIVWLLAITSLFSKNDKRLTDIATIILYPAEFALGAGIFIGAIWANNSWGRYWGWDPKETWALITFLVYSVPLHGMLAKWLRKPRVLNIYYLLAFLCVLFTYFGVNFLLGGLHSYA